jgi:hypothetical protein
MSVRPRRERFVRGCPWVIRVDTPTWALRFVQRCPDNSLVYGSAGADRRPHARLACEHLTDPLLARPADTGLAAGRCRSAPTCPSAVPAPSPASTCAVGALLADR